MSFEALQDAVNALELTPEQKASILGPGKDLNVDNGKKGSDLINLRKEMETKDKKIMDYKTFSESLAKHNVKVEDIKKLAENAGIERGHQDEIDELTRIIKETQLANKAQSEELRIFKQEKTLGPQFEQSLKDFKVDGKEVVLRPAFVDGIKEELFKSIADGDNEVINQDKINKALLQAKSNQDKFLTDNGLVPTDTPIHKVNEGSTTGSASSSGINTEELRKIIESGGGSTDSVALAMARARQQKEGQ